MAYTKTNWQDGVTPLSAANMNKIEQGIYEAFQAIEEPLYQTITSEGESVISLPSSTEDKGQISVGLKGQTIFQHANNGTDNSNWVIEGTNVSVSANGITWSGVSGTADKVSLRYENGHINLKTNTTYTIILNVKEINTSSGDFSLRHYYDAFAGSSSLSITINNVGQFRYKLTTINDFTYNSNENELNRVLYYVPLADGESVTIDDIMVLEGDWTDKEVHYMSYGVNSTNSVRIKDVGKNILNLANGTVTLEGVTCAVLNNEITLNGTATSNIWVKLTRNIEASTSRKSSWLEEEGVKVVKDNNYVLSHIVVSGAGSNVAYALRSKSDNSVIAGNTGSTNGNETLTETVYPYAYLFIASGYSYSDYKFKLQIEQGDTATEYEPYKESVSYITLPDGVDGLNSLPNGVKDEVNVDDGKLIKRINKVILDNNSGFTNFVYDSETGHSIMVILDAKDIFKWYNDDFDRFYAWNDERVFDIEGGTIHTGEDAWEIQPNDPESKLWLRLAGVTTEQEFLDYLAAHPITLIYQLAEPVTYDLNITPLTAYENGTVYIEKAIPEVSFYDSTNGCVVSDTNYPISSIDFIYKVNQEDGSYIALDVSQATIAGDGLSFTHPDLTNGDLVDWDYFYAEELGTYPASEITVATNHKATTVSQGEAINQLSKNVQNIDTRVVANKQSLEELQQPSKIKELYESNTDTNAFTDAEKTKLAGIEAGAEVNPTSEEIANMIAQSFTELSTSSAQVTNASQWEDWDISAYVPANRLAYVMIVSNESTSSRVVGIRKKGSSVSRTFDLRAGNQVIIPVVTNENGIVEIYAESNISIYFSVVGYV